MNRSFQGTRSVIPALIGIAAAFQLLLGHALADDAKLRYFEQKIRPLLVERCHDCHSQDNPESKLRLDSLEGLLKGGIRGPAIVPGKPKESLLIRALGHGERLQMPPKKKLPVARIAEIAKWIADGAHWPNADIESIAKSLKQTSSGVSDKDRKFWSFQPIRRPELPRVKEQSWVQSPVDYFVLAQLEAKGIRPARPVSKRVLLRRVYLDLIGIPPTPSEAEAFFNDDSSDAYQRLVDRLLSSPRYGERWGRHWLDVARFADSNGLDENLAYGNAYRYRDYVISAWNADKPFDRFVQEQIAGDLLPDGDMDGLMATAFLSLGAKMLAEDDPVKMQMDIIDEQVDTLGRTFMGLTLGCARCHDHKFDPIPTADYYSLVGIFKSTKTMDHHRVVARWQEVPLASPETAARIKSIDADIAEKNKKAAKIKGEAEQRVLADARSRLGSYLLAAHDEIQLAERIKAINEKSPLKDGLVIEAEAFKEGNLTRFTDGYGEGIGVIAGPGGRNHCKFEFKSDRDRSVHLITRVAAADSRPTKFIVNGRTVTATGAAVVTGSWYPDTQRWITVGVAKLKKGTNEMRLERDGPIPHFDKFAFLDGQPLAQDRERLVNEIVKLLKEALTSKTPKPTLPKALKNFLAKPEQGRATAAAKLQKQLAPLLNDAQTKSPNEELSAVKKYVLDPAGPFRVVASLDSQFNETERDAIKKLYSDVATLQKQKPTPPMAMAVSEGQIQNVRIHLRGSHLTLGKEVPRRFLQVASRTNPQIGEKESGRRQLAEWITSPQHPLTARVIANRVWLWHFGQGIVRSPDNFGQLGERPTHPQLLDWLASKLVSHNWSIKQLHRTILLSSAYRMSSEWSQSAAEKDPENKLFWRWNRRRLEAEAIRDALLKVSGELELSMGGTMLTTKNRAYVTSTANVSPKVYQSNRRSVYLPVVRSAVYEVLQAFDFPDPAVLNGQRQTTTVAPQALFMLNSQFVTDRMDSMAKSLIGAREEQIKEAYRRCFTREPTPAELERALEYLTKYTQAVKTDKITDQMARTMALKSLCRALISTNEFVFVE